jgi:hypothetical protein
MAAMGRVGPTALLLGSACAAALLLGLAAAAIVGGSGCARSPAPPGLTPPAERQGDPAPDFALKDLKGQEYHLRDHVGTSLIVIQFGSFT